MITVCLRSHDTTANTIVAEAEYEGSLTQQEFLIKYKVFINYISWYKIETTIRVYGSHIIPPGAPFIDMDYLNPGMDK